MKTQHNCTTTMGVPAELDFLSSGIYVLTTEAKDK